MPVFSHFCFDFLFIWLLGLDSIRCYINWATPNYNTSNYLRPHRVNYISFSGVPFPKNFQSIAKTILKRLFRVYAHIYHQHFSEVVQLGEEAHLNTSFKHFIFFVQEFSLIERRELAPLQELIDKLTAKEQR